MSNKNNFFKEIKNLNSNQRYLYYKKELYYYEEDKVIKGLSNVNNSWYKDFFLLEADEMDRLLRLIETTDFGKINKIPLSTYDGSKKLLIFDNNQIKAIDILKQEIIELTEKEKAFAYVQLFNNALLKDEDVITLLENRLIDKVCNYINVNNRNLLVVSDSRFKFCCIENKKPVTPNSKAEEDEIYTFITIKNSSLKHFKNNVIRGNLVRSYIKNSNNEYIVFGNKNNQVLKREEFKSEEFLNNNFYYYINNNIIKTKDYYIKIQNTYEYDKVEYVVYNYNSNELIKLIFPAFTSIKSEELNELINKKINNKEKIPSWYKKNIEIPGIEKEIKPNGTFYFHLQKIIGDFYYYKEYECEKLAFLKNINIVGYNNKIYYVSYDSDFNPTNEVTPELLEKAELETQSIILGASI